jgi:hypothetical protein
MGGNTAGVRESGGGAERPCLAKATQGEARGGGGEG